MAHTQWLPAGRGADYKRVKGVSLFANVLPSSWQKGGCAAFISLYNEPGERGEG